jgi:hypothetical protein
MTGQDPADRSSMEFVGARQVTDSLTSQIGLHQRRLIVFAEVNLPLSYGRQLRAVSEARCALTSDNAVEPFEILPRVRIRKRVQETLNLLDLPPDWV